MSSVTAPRPHFPAPEAALPLLGDAVAHRVELALLELDEAREHGLRSLLLAGVVTALVLGTGLASTLLVASLVWDDPHRTWWLGGLSLADLAAAAVTAGLLARRLRRWRPLDEIRRQLARDGQCLTNLLKSAAN